ncbi:hemerythrin domain-containing protein [Altericroceibacterium xinjiangense]|uniref:hemerythrin domain-containing protein n=1 Tax=Altericroceibacterium xinjiangense TaxID=762261 RepID=UPI000F7E568F|nr:hemerythrin domain-containing protein [Altericroceibacterium xinjiangense]
MDITMVILEEHNQLRTRFAALEQMRGADPEVLEGFWRQLHNLLDVHAEAEEKFFYPDLLQVGTGANDADSAEEETTDAIEDHNDIRDAAAAVGQHKVGSDEWFAAVQKANVENSKHMAEEERQALTDFRRNASLQDRHELAVRFLGYRYGNAGGIDAQDKDAEQYIAKHTA